MLRLSLGLLPLDLLRYVIVETTPRDIRLYLEPYYS
jgi:hypothetical protein